MIKLHDNGSYEGTYIIFHPVPAPGERKTSAWCVHNKTEMRGSDPVAGLLGEVWWFTRWRKYIFHPHDGCLFEQVCMREIAEFVEARTAEHRAALKGAAKVLNHIG